MLLFYEYDYNNTGMYMLLCACNLPIWIGCKINVYKYILYIY